MVLWEFGFEKNENVDLQAKLKKLNMLESDAVNELQKEKVKSGSSRIRNNTCTKKIYLKENVQWGNF